MKNTRFTGVMLLMFFTLSIVALHSNNLPKEFFQTYPTFILTKSLGKPLKTNAHFITNGSGKWLIDYRQGDKIYYTVISMNEKNPMCGISARDNFGDKVDICITKTSGDGVSIELKYGERRMVYTGYIKR